MRQPLNTLSSPNNDTKINLKCQNIHTIYKKRLVDLLTSFFAVIILHHLFYQKYCKNSNIANYC